MTIEKFIKKWLDCKKPYNEENRDAMRDDLYKVYHSQIMDKLIEFINWMENDCLLDDLYKDKNLTVSEYLQTCKKCGSRDKLRNGLCYGCKCLANI